MMKLVEEVKYRSPELKSKEGSIALEAAISISLLLLVQCFMLMAIISSQLEAAVGAALENTAAEISLLLPVADLAIEDCEPIQDAIADLDEIDNQLADSLFLKYLFDGSITDLVSSVLLGELIEQRCDFWLQDASSGQQLYLHLLQNKYVELMWHDEENFLILQANFEIKTIFGEMKRTARAVVPIWTGKSRFVEADDEKTPNVWSLDNFSRGIALREHFGADLPLSYPVIASFNNGTACAIRSMDLTAPSYQDQDKVVKAVAAEIDRLADFAGYKGSSKMPAIDIHMIIDRKLMLIIPTNSPASFENEILPEITMLANSRNIRLEAIRYLSSDRWQAELVS